MLIFFDRLSTTINKKVTKYCKSSDLGGNSNRGEGFIINHHPDSLVINMTIKIINEFISLAARMEDDDETGKVGITVHCRQQSA